MSTKKKYVDAGDINLDEEEIYVDGERLTEERAGKLGRELDDRTHTRRQAGRPSLATGVSNAPSSSGCCCTVHTYLQDRKGAGPSGQHRDP